MDVHEAGSHTSLSPENIVRTKLRDTNLNPSSNARFPPWSEAICISPSVPSPSRPARQLHAVFKDRARRSSRNGSGVVEQICYKGAVKITEIKK